MLPLFFYFLLPWPTLSAETEPVFGDPSEAIVDLFSPWSVVILFGTWLFFAEKKRKTKCHEQITKCHKQIIRAV